MSCSCEINPRDSSITYCCINEYDENTNNTTMGVFILSDGRFYIYLSHQYGDVKDHFGWQHDKRDHICPQDWDGTVPRFKIEYPNTVENKLHTMLTAWYSERLTDRYVSDWYD